MKWGWCECNCWLLLLCCLSASFYMSDRGAFEDAMDVASANVRWMQVPRASKSVALNSDDHHAGRSARKSPAKAHRNRSISTRRGGGSTTCTVRYPLPRAPTTINQRCCFSFS